MRNVKVGFKKNEYYQADQLPRFTRYECQSRHLLVQDELEQLSVSSVFLRKQIWDEMLGTQIWKPNLNKEVRGNPQPESTESLANQKCWFCRK